MVTIWQRVVDARAGQMRDDQVADAEPLADAQVVVDAVTEQGMDHAAAIANRDQPGLGRAAAAAPAHEPQPLICGNTGIMHEHQRIGHDRMLMVDRKCLELLVHRRIPR
ncbi:MULTISPECIES: hypothetical protein [unclassified Bradyrhizobium]